MSNGSGPGVRRFWELTNQREAVDLAALCHDFPEEAAALGQAAIEAARRGDARVRERLWQSRNRLLLARDTQVSFGETLKERRLSCGLTEQALAEHVSHEGGTRIVPQAIQRLEAGTLSPLAVKPASAWRGFVAALAFDPALLMSLLELSARQTRDTQHFTRMARDATDDDRAQFLTDMRGQNGDNIQQYLDTVRRELGLPSRALP